MTGPRSRSSNDLFKKLKTIINSFQRVPFVWRGGLAENGTTTALLRAKRNRESILTARRQTGTEDTSVVF